MRRGVEGGLGIHQTHPEQAPFPYGLKAMGQRSQGKKTLKRVLSEKLMLG
jgi:hypothetical protein